MADLPACYCDSCGITAHPEKFYPDRAVQRDVMEVLVKCGYHAAGCPWVGQLKAWENHVDVCKYHTVSCPHRGCEVVLPYNRLESHQQACQFRRVTCEYCKTEISISQLKVIFNVLSFIFCFDFWVQKGRFYSLTGHGRVALCCNSASLCCESSPQIVAIVLSCLSWPWKPVFSNLGKLHDAKYLLC